MTPPLCGHWVLGAEPQRLLARREGFLHYRILEQDPRQKPMALISRRLRPKTGIQLRSEDAGFLRSQE